MPPPVSTAGAARAIRRGLAAVPFLAALAHPVLAAEETAGQSVFSFTGQVSLGTAVRADDRDPRLLPTGNATALGIAGLARAGRNQDDGNLNYAKGDTVATVLKGLFDLAYRQPGGGAFLRLKAWHDAALEHDAVPWGNLANGYAAGRPLSDTGFSPRARFSGLVAEDAYVYGDYAPGDKPLHARLGWQTLDWGSRSAIAGGLAAVMPVDHSALRRPGATADEGRIAIPAVFARLQLDARSSVEGFYQLGFRPSELLGCGSFFAAADYAAQGCNMVLLASNPAATDRALYAAGSYMGRADDLPTKDGGQFGIAYQYTVPAIGTQFGFYASRYHSRTPMYGPIKNSNPGNVPLTPPFNAGDVRYFAEYPEGIQSYSLNFASRLPGLYLMGEYTYRPNQPVQLSTVDLLYAFTSNTLPTPLRADAEATPAGGIYHGYDRRKVSHLSLGARLPLAGWLGAHETSISGELGAKFVHDLPDVAVRRYGRSDLYGQSGFGGSTSSPAIANGSNAGYVTASSWGYRLKLALAYRKVAGGLDLLPALTLARDAKGWSPDGVFSAGRQTVALALRGEYRQDYYAELALNAVSGGAANNLSDRSHAAAVIGMKF